MKFSVSFSLILASVLTLSNTAIAQGCQPACCDVLVKGIDDTNVGCE